MGVCLVNMLAKLIICSLFSTVFNCFKCSISFFGMMLHWHWIAMIISKLSSQVIVLPFHSIAEMVKTNDYRLYAEPGTYHVDAFKLSTDPVWNQAWNEKIEPSLEEFKHMKGIEKAIEFAIKSNPTLAVYGTVFHVG
jgi:hypothetical protein